jgi:hypothetical protein
MYAQASSGNGSLNLEEKTLDKHLMIAYSQNNLKASRKQLQPVVEAFMQSRGS